LNQLIDSVAQAPSLSEFAEQFGMSESRFSRFFRRATGTTSSTS
jgi:AraC-like DNA-binding protein